MEMKFKTLLGSGWEGGLLSGTVIREFNTLVDTWEMNERVEKSYPVEASLKDFILVDILSKVISDNSILCWLNTFDRNSDVYYKGDESQTQR
jgi:hypothetical protein